MNDIFVEQIRPELTWRLRKQILYPSQPLHAMEMDEDNQGLHFGAFCNNELVSVVSLFQKDHDFQFRKFAVAPHMQNRGVGALVLQHIVNFARSQGGTRIWCNARLSATGFYQKAGFAFNGQAFSKNGFDYEIMEKTI